MRRWSFVLGLALAFPMMAAGATDPDCAGQTITVLASQPHVVGTKTLSALFEKETGCKVNVMVTPMDNMTEKVVLDVQSGANILDLYMYWYPALGALVENGAMEDVTDWWNANAAKLKFNEDLIAETRDAYTLLNGRRYGYPYDGDMHILWYLKPVFEKYKLSPPKTWDEYLAIEKLITEKENGKMYGAIIMGAKFPMVIISAYADRMGGFGGSFLDKNGKPAINSPENVAALAAYVEQAKYALPTPSATNFDEEVGGWITGKAAMTEFWTDLGTISSDPKSSTIIGQYDCAPLPRGPGPKGQVVAPLNAGFGMAVSAKSQHKKIAMKYLSFMARPDVTLKYNTVIGGIDPVRWSTVNDPAYLKFSGPNLVAAIKEAHKHNVQWPTNANWFKMQEPLADNLSMALSGEKNPQKALDDTQKAWIEIMK